MTAVVFGPPAAMGSKRGFIVKGRVNIVDAKPGKLRSFQAEMRDSMRADAPATPHLGPISIDILVYLARPKNHFGSGKNAAKLKESAPQFPTTKPDIDKIVRAVLDCGTNLWFKDDSQVVSLSAMKVYTSSEEMTQVEAVAL